MISFQIAAWAKNAISMSNITFKIDIGHISVPTGDVNVPYWPTVLSLQYYLEGGVVSEDDWSASAVLDNLSPLQACEMDMSMT